jgi:Kef-type K+ transport system membrane component KefB
MTPFLQLTSMLVIILVAAKLAGWLTTRLGQPSVLGELLVGIALGPSLLDITHLQFVTDSHLTEVLIQLGELGVLLIMFIAGMELHLEELASHVKISAYSGALGVLLPVLMGWGVGALFGMDTRAALFLGLTLGATSVSISVQTLMELKALRTRVGLALLGAAVFDDVLVIVLLSIFLALSGGGGGFARVGWIFTRILAFLLLSMAFGRWVLPRLTRRVAELHISQGSLALAVVVMLVYGLAAEIVGGMAAITGTFIAGLMYARSSDKSRVETGLLALSYGFFVPIFFISIGLSINLRQVPVSALWLLMAVCVIAIAGKWLGAGLGARLGGLNWKESIQLGAGMVSRGEVGLIVGAVGLSNGLVTDAEFSAIIGMVVITTLVTPVLLRWLFNRNAAAASEQDQQGA